MGVLCVGSGGEPDFFVCAFEGDVKPGKEGMYVCFWYEKGGIEWKEGGGLELTVVPGRVQGEWCLECEIFFLCGENIDVLYGIIAERFDKGCLSCGSSGQISRDEDDIP